ncbi:hypothetical protein BGW38_005159 [Lunasporangiospora selenospora]|uniref:D-xylose 1-dehydrogenase (NADP(+), D-xylono-1,5-lactone-forming) n=1 Tax=Lunasporangiospora selenospora TaxID=979761 RepID=A0A9P6KBJ6_9FUNG|nr:hypothetical protein BGW38_005159 [Lunasporangiospora selenospora]
MASSATSEGPGIFTRLRLASPKTSVSKEPNALRIGILGAANIAPDALINPAKLMRDIVVVSVAARDENKAKAYAARYGIPNTHPSYDALLSDPAIDCIYNPLPNGLHFEWTQKALQAGKHVLLEKPSASNATQTKKLFELAKEKNLILLEAYHYRFHPASTFFRDLIQQHVKEGYPLTRLYSRMTLGTIFPADDIRFQYSLAGGVFMDCGSYTVNATRFFSGLEIESIESATPKIIGEQVDGRMDVIANMKTPQPLQDGQKLQASLMASLTDPWLSFKTWKQLFPMFIAETDAKIFTFGVWVMPNLYHYMTVKDKATGKSETIKRYDSGHSTYYYQLEAFVKAIKSGGNDIQSIPGWVSGEDSVANMEVIDKVYLKAGLKVRE